MVNHKIISQSHTADFSIRHFTSPVQGYTYEPDIAYAPHYNPYGPYSAASPYPSYNGFGSALDYPAQNTVPSATHYPQTAQYPGIDVRAVSALIAHHRQATQQVSAHGQYQQRVSQNLQTMKQNTNAVVRFISKFESRFLRNLARILTFQSKDRIESLHAARIRVKQAHSDMQPLQNRMQSLNGQIHQALEPEVMRQFNQISPHFRQLEQQNQIISGHKQLLHQAHQALKHARYTEYGDMFTGSMLISGGSYYKIRQVVKAVDKLVQNHHAISGYYPEFHNLNHLVQDLSQRTAKMKKAENMDMVMDMFTDFDIGSMNVLHKMSKLAAVLTQYQHGVDQAAQRREAEYQAELQKKQALFDQIRRDLERQIP